MTAIRAPRTPVAGSLAAHALILLGLALGGTGGEAEEAGPGGAPAAFLAGPGVDLEDGIEPDVLETKPIDEAEAIVECLGDPRFNADSPFLEAGPDASIGVGGGATRFFCGRGGGQRSLTVSADLDPLASLRPGSAEGNTDSFDAREENPFHGVEEAPLSTFSIDVDTASFTVVRSFLERGTLPPRGAVRIEEMVNWFPYGYAPPAGAEPFAVRAAVAAAPWNPAHRLLRVAIRGRSVAEAERPPANLVFLVDVSGSMEDPDRLPLVQAGLRLLAERLDARDRVALVVYAGASGLVLPSTPGSARAAILDAVDRLQAGGSTNGGAGIVLAYRVAAENRIAGGINRVILATDGDFNVGVTNRSDLVDLVAAKAKEGTFLTVLGFGRGNLKDDALESLADRGNGNYAYIDSLAEARKVLVEHFAGTLQVIAKDVKIQVEFNPARAAGYRLLGYENRVLAARDFRDDAKDAGEIGAGHCVTAFYEVVPAGAAVPGAGVDPLRYRATGGLTPEGEGSGELATVKLRWKEPDGEASAPAEFPVVDGGAGFDGADDDFRFAAAVAGFGMVLRESPHAGGLTLAAVREIAAGALGEDAGGHRAAFLGLVGLAEKAGGRAGERR